jgi:BioD-like phosphotransacetylase family protein
MKNIVTPRVFIAATRQNDGKTTTSLGLLSALRKYYPRIGYIKPVGQRFVDVADHKIDEDSFLMDKVYSLNCPLPEMSPIAVASDFTRNYLESSNNDQLIQRVEKAFDRVAWEKDFVLCEGTGHAGVGSVFDLSNARVAKILHAKVVLVTQGGIGRPIDEIALNQALFEKDGVEIIGVILNKVRQDKVDYVTEFAKKGLERKGLHLLGVIPHQRILSSPTIELIRDGLKADMLNDSNQVHNIVDSVVVAAMSARNARQFFRPGALIILPADREDLIETAASTCETGLPTKLAGIVLTDEMTPSTRVLQIIRRMPYPVMMTHRDSYQVASSVHDLIVKTRPGDAAKIALIRDLVSNHVHIHDIVDRTLR